jgi:hypothetical protein
MAYWIQRNYKMNIELAQYIREHYGGLKPWLVCDLVERRFEIKMSRSSMRELLGGRSWRPPRISARELENRWMQTQTQAQSRRPARSKSAAQVREGAGERARRDE